VSGFLAIFYISTADDGFWNIEGSATGFLSTECTVSCSVFVTQKAVTTGPNPQVRGPLGVAAEIQLIKCPDRVKSDESDRNICRPLIAGDSSSNMRPKFAFITGAEYAQRTQRENCRCFRSDLGYFVSPEDTTDEEREFPLAFSLLTHENLEQTERLLRLIYRPHNIYCIHVDAKSPAEFYRRLEAIANCLDNVFMAKPQISVYWGEISLLQADILCAQQLLEKHKQWKYFINLVGRDFPLRTNYELVKILKAYDGANDVDGTRDRQR